MFDTDAELLAAAAQWHDTAVSLAAAFRTQRPGPVAAQVLAELLGGTRQGELASCLAIESTDRSGEFAVDGAASATAYVGTTANETRPWASQRVHIGRALIDRLPATRTAWERGDLGLAHAWEIVKATRDIDDPALVADLDRILADATPAVSPTDLRNLGERIRAQHTPDAADKKTAAQHARQQLTLSETMDGRWDLHGRFDPEAGILIKHALDAFTARPTADQIAADPALALTPGQRRAAALVEICRQAADHHTHCTSNITSSGGGAGSRATLIVAIPLADLQSGHGVADVAGGDTLPAAVLRRWACDIGLLPAVLGADSQILDYGRRTRLISPGLRSYLVARDGGCVFPGRDRPPAWTEAHHRIHVIDGGHTTPENLDLLCSRHHHLLHEGGWALTITNDQNRTPLFHLPGGKPPLPGKRKPLIHLPQPRTKTPTPTPTPNARIMRT